MVFQNINNFSIAFGLPSRPCAREKPKFLLCSLQSPVGFLKHNPWSKTQVRKLVSGINDTSDNL